MIAQQHAKTIKNWTLKEDKEFNKRFYDFRTIHSAVRLTKEQQLKIKERAENIERENEEIKCITNNDFSPKQIFIKNDGNIGICDFELLSPGIASYDIGFFIGNIKIIEIIKKQPEISKIINIFLEEYFNIIKKELKEPDKFINFTKEHLNFFIGLGILNRIDAVPLEKHIPENSVKELREEAVKFIFS